MNSAIGDIAKEKAGKAIGGGGGAGGSPEDAMLEAEKLKGQNRLEEGIKALQDKLASVAAKVESGGGGGGSGGAAAAAGGGGGAMAPAMAASQQKIAVQIGSLGETVGKLAGEVEAMKDNSKMWAAAGGGASAAAAGGAGGASNAVIGQMAGNAIGSALKAVEGVSQASQLINSAHLAVGGGGGGLGVVGLLPAGTLANAGAGVGTAAGLGLLGAVGVGAGGVGVGAGGGGGGASIIGGSSLAADNDVFAGSELTSQQKALSNILGIASKRAEMKNKSTDEKAKVSKRNKKRKGSEHNENAMQRDLLFSAPIDEKNDIKISGLLIPIVKRNKVSVLVPRGRNRATFNYTAGHKFIPKEDTGKGRPLTGDKAVKQAQENGNGFLGTMPSAGKISFLYLSFLLIFSAIIN